MDFDYYYGPASESFCFFRIPRVLITAPWFKLLSPSAKLLYGLMLDRMGLSARNGWYDDFGRVFIYYTLDEVQKEMHCCRCTAEKLLTELGEEPGFGLIERVRQGQGRPSRIYVKQITAPMPSHHSQRLPGRF